MRKLLSKPFNAVWRWIQCLVQLSLDKVKPSRICSREGHNMRDREMGVICKPHLARSSGSLAVKATAKYRHCTRCGMVKSPHEFKYVKRIHRLQLVDHLIDQWEDRGWFRNGDIVTYF